MLIFSYPVTKLAPLEIILLEKLMDLSTAAQTLAEVWLINMLSKFHQFDLPWVILIHSTLSYYLEPILILSLPPQMPRNPNRSPPFELSNRYILTISHLSHACFNSDLLISLHLATLRIHAEWPGQLSRYSDSLRTGRSGVPTRLGRGSPHLSRPATRLT